MATTNADQQRKSRQDAEAVENFSKRYYDILDTRRHNVDKFYQNQAKLIWNVGLPPTKHHIYALDFFPMKDLFPDEDTTYQVFVSGAVVYGSVDSVTITKEKRLFSHAFILTVDNITSTWVIVNESFRFHE
ncbi:unnamed protein product [Adineta ricciae]|uniref:NTF2 domain-containing protein n=1 Tax=Adineta ricciae TaxID=249248 RepID=A0A814LKA5_ADIRI|nr:unnamed protein product [Adineta ricciae]